MERLRRYHPRKSSLLKFCLRCLSIVLSIVVIGLSTNDEIRLASPNPVKNWQICLAIAVYGIVLDFLELALTLDRNRSPGARPVWRIGLEILFLGTNVLGIYFTSTNFYIDFDGGYEIVILIPLALITVTRIALLICASVETYKKALDSAVDNFAEALRRLPNDDRTAATALITYPYQYYNLPPPAQELPGASQSPPELHSKPAYELELLGNTEFPAELGTSSSIGGLERTSSVF
ncbi:hypothetical protein F5Y10DRAFT_240200 [Nemania abortiva]|nr:hypothetical protein F5Y10DRAFT_240200 [Nemania abortiva]